MQHLVEYLLSAGFSEREARIYLTGISLGRSSVADLAKESQMTRTTVYGIVDDLELRGLVNFCDVAGKRMLTFESPDKLIVLLEKKAEELIRSIGKMESALPELMAVENSREHKPRVLFFEGKDGITRLAERYEDKVAEFFEIVPFDSLSKFFDEHEFDSHKNTLARNRVKGKIIIVADSPPIESMKRVHNRFGWEVKYLQTGSSALSGHISVKGNEIYGFSYHGAPMGVVIENEPLASALRVVFELAWQSAPTEVSFPPQPESAQTIEQFEIN